MPTQRTGSPLTDGRGRDAARTAARPSRRPPRRLARSSSRAVSSGRSPPSRPRRSPPSSRRRRPGGAEGERGVVQPYGQPAFENLFAAERAGRRQPRRRLVAGRSVLGRDRPGRSGRRRHVRPSAARRAEGPVGQVAFGLVFGLVGLVVALFITNGNTTHADESTATGTVIAHTTHVDDDGKTLCSPVASFTVDGATHRASSNVSSSSCPSDRVRRDRHLHHRESRRRRRAHQGHEPDGLVHLAVPARRAGDRRRRTARHRHARALDPHAAPVADAGELRHPPPCAGQPPDRGKQGRPG